MKAILVGSLVLLLCITSAHAAFLTRTEDGNGWTVFTPSADTDVVYISASGDNSTCTSYRTSDEEMGSDPFEPDGAVIPCEDFATARTKVASGGPDWILWKRGETFVESSGLGTVHLSGKDADEPFLISAYGTSGVSPVIKVGSNNEGILIQSDTSNLAIAGLDFYQYLRNPDDGGSVTTGDRGMRVYAGSNSTTITGILVEGCKFRFFENGITTESGNGNVVTEEIDIEFRRNLITDNYNTTGHSQGYFAYRADDILVEENIFIHNGWLVPSTSGGQTAAGGQSTIYNHSIYNNSVDNHNILRNIFVDPSAACIKLTKSYTSDSTLIDNNLAVGGQIFLSAGVNGNPGNFDDITISNNVHTQSGRMDLTDTTDSYGIWACGLNRGLIDSNLIINLSIADNIDNGHALATCGDPVWSTTYSNNVIHDLHVKRIVFISANSAGSTNVSVTDNIFNAANITNVAVVYADYNIVGNWTFSGNSWYADSQAFYRNGSYVTLSGWNSWVGDTTSTWGETSFTDDTRDIDTYMQSLGETATIDAFIAKLRAFDRWTNWNTAYSAETINSWIRVGFDMEEYTSTPRTMQGLTINGGTIR